MSIRQLPTILAPCATGTSAHRARIPLWNDWNDWVTTADLLRPVVDSGIWEGIVSTASSGDHYKFHLDGREKADPLAFEAEVPPKNASIVFRSEYSWNDDAWVEARDSRSPFPGIRRLPT